MPPLSITKENKIRWDGKKNPFYEIYYVTLTSPNQWSLWVRYTILSPHAHLGKPTVSLWGFFREEGKAPIALKETWAVDEVDLFHRDSFIQMKDNFLSLTEAKGAIEGDGTRLDWDFFFEDPQTSLRLYQPNFFYSLSFPKTKFLDPLFSTFVSGSITINKQKYSFNHLPAHQGHLWGPSYAPAWAWAHCNDFVEDPSAAFEGLWAQPMTGAFQEFSAALFFFRTKHVTVKANNLLLVHRNSSRHVLLEWSFKGDDGKYKINGKITRATRDIMGVTYEGPEGEKRFCHNSLNANLQITLSEKRNKEWKEMARFTAPGRTAFETVEPEPDSQVKFVL